MVFRGHEFRIMYDDSIMFDEDLKPESLKVKEGDVFVVAVVNNKIILKKQSQ